VHQISVNGVKESARTAAFRYVGVLSNNLTEFFAVNGFFSIRDRLSDPLPCGSLHQPLCQVVAIFYNGADLVIDSRGDRLSILSAIQSRPKTPHHFGFLKTADLNPTFQTWSPSAAPSPSLVAGHFPHQSTSESQRLRLQLHSPKAPVIRALMRARISPVLR